MTVVAAEVTEAKTTTATTTNGDEEEDEVTTEGVAIVVASPQAQQQHSNAPWAMMTEARYVGHGTAQGPIAEEEDEEENDDDDDVEEARSPQLVDGLTATGAAMAIPNKVLVRHNDVSTGPAAPTTISSLWSRNTTTNTQQQQQHRVAPGVCIFLIVVGMAVVALVVIAGLCGFDGCSSSGSVSTAPIETMTMNRTETMNNTEMIKRTQTMNRTEPILQFLNTETLSGQTLRDVVSDTDGSSTTTTTPTSAEVKASQWLIHKDPLQLLPTDSLSSQFRLRQRFALLTLWFQQEQSTTTNTQWTSTTDWLTNTDECTWHGVTCEQMNLGEDIGPQNAVTKLVLSNNNVHGTIPPDIGLLTSIVVLSLGSNALFGSLPSSLRLLTNMQLFAIYENAITGTLPASVGEWSKVSHASWSKNELTGTLPTSIGKWTAILDFRIGDNRIVGSIPASVGQWKQVTVAYFQNNQLTGTVPTGLCRASDLRADCELNCTCCYECV